MGTNARASVHEKQNAQLARRALRVTEAAATLGISRSSIYSLIRSGLIGYVRLAGGSIRVPASEIDRFIDSNVVRSEE
jgi:excisionase family DNA binding protein